MQPKPFNIVKPIKLFYLISPFHHFLKKIATGGMLLICSAFVALLWANLAYDSYHSFWHTDITFSLGSLSITKSVQHWIDEALMTLFFFTVGLEIKREMLIGELAQLRKASLPIAAAAGGMIVPAGVTVMPRPSGKVSVFVADLWTLREFNARTGEPSLIKRHNLRN